MVAWYLNFIAILQPLEETANITEAFMGNFALTNAPPAPQKCLKVKLTLVLLSLLLICALDSLGPHRQSELKSWRVLLHCFEKLLKFDSSAR